MEKSNWMGMSYKFVFHKHLFFLWKFISVACYCLFSIHTPNLKKLVFCITDYLYIAKSTLIHTLVNKSIMYKCSYLRFKLSRMPLYYHLKLFPSKFVGYRARPLKEMTIFYDQL